MPQLGQQPDGALRTRAAPLGYTPLWNHYLHEPNCDPVEQEWYGRRPMTCDDKPIIDRSPRMANVWLATGHSMVGVSMAPATGKLVAELVTEATPHVNPQPFAVTRFRRR